jgi:hypothetical protein
MVVLLLTSDFAGSTSETGVGTDMMRILDALNGSAPFGGAVRRDRKVGGDLLPARNLMKLVA